MPALVLELSKYVFIVLMAVYVALAFFALRKRDDDQGKAIYYFMEVLTLIFYTMGPKATNLLADYNIVSP